MFRLGLRLTFASGKEALVRLVLTAAAVSIGCVILLAVLANFHGFQASNNKQNWAATKATQDTNSPASMLWNYSNDMYQGKTIKRLDIAALGPDAPVLPGIPKLPEAGEYYVSPAMARLLATTDKQDLGDRFPGKQIGTITDAALTNPEELVIFIGRNPSNIAHLENTIHVTEIATGKQTSIWTDYFQYAFIVGIIAFLFPIVVLIGTATRLASARREERFAALRLIGASSKQLYTLVSIEAAISGLCGVLLGVVIFLLFQNAWSHVELLNTPFFAYTVKPTWWEYVGLVIVVPMLSAAAAIFSLKRVRITPLGVSRRLKLSTPSAWRVALLALGLVLLAVGLATTNSGSIGITAYPGFLFILVGLLIIGPWVTMVVAKVSARFTRSASMLLATRRLLDNSKLAFRSVSGLVLAVFLGSVVAVMLPLLDGGLKNPRADALSNVLYQDYSRTSTCATDGGECQEGLLPKEASGLVEKLRSFDGVSVVPMYVNPNQKSNVGGELASNNAPVLPNVVSCKDLAAVPALGACPSGAQAVAIYGSGSGEDNPTNYPNPIVQENSQATSLDVSNAHLRGVFVDTRHSQSLEEIRTFLATHAAENSSSTAPRTYGEAIQIRMESTSTIQRIFYIAIVLTLFVAGCSLAVSIGGSMIERKRPFGLLRVTGVSVRVLYRVVLYEAALPLFAVVILAALLGYGIGVASVAAAAPSDTKIPLPSNEYLIIMCSGLVLAFVIICLTLPILRSITQPDKVRFE